MLNDAISNSYIPCISLCFPSFLMTDYARKMALDMRMIDPDKYDDHPDNKASHCAAKIAEYYKSMTHRKAHSSSSRIWGRTSRESGACTARLNVS